VYAGSVLISLVATLVAAAFLPRLYTRPFSAVLLTLVLVALGLAIGLHVRFLVLLRREQRETARALTTTEHEFQSIFDSALDGLVILDDHGNCVEANPSAVAVLETRREDLVGHALRQFLGDSWGSPGEEFSRVGSQDGRGEIELVRGDGHSISVEYSTNANYLPFRHCVVLRDISKRKRALAELRQSEERFVQMADNIREIFWMIDAESKQVIYVNQAFETVTGRSLETLRANPTSYQELFHPEDRVRILTRLEEAARTGRFDEEFRIVRQDHAIRWVWVRGFPVRDSSGGIRRLVGTAQDVTSRKSAEEQITRSLALAESASAEADALRKTTLALTQNLSMDYVLDTLLASLLDLIPCDSARVLLVETDDRLFLARERNAQSGRPGVQTPRMTWNATDHAPLALALATQEAVLVRSSSDQEGWSRFKGHSQFHSWLGVPLIASGSVLGLLSLGDSEVAAFTKEHVRLAKSLAIPAAVAIQNARLYERAEIYGAELQRRLADLEQTQKALEQAERNRGQFAR
jgi:PAS domain S-box-containing protein